jgi:hypothetical protein
MSGLQDHDTAATAAPIPELVTEVQDLSFGHGHSESEFVPATSPRRLEEQVDQSNTILYLAYGSNLCAETFLGRRGIRPLSQVNVSAPTLRFTLGLPGFPYIEPRFANVDLRKLPEKPPLPVPHPPSPPLPFDPRDYAQGQWDGGLMGVVYEVTPQDYRQIMRTEGGGSGYKEIIVPCVPIPPNVGVPEKPPIPELPKPIFARTLYSPSLPNNGGAAQGSEKRSWWRRFLVGRSRPDPERGQASARYLKLITDGAREHDLPEDYQRYLNSLQPYTVTRWSQTLGKIFFGMTFALPFVILTLVGKQLADDNGHYPAWFAALLNVLFNTVWAVYDNIAKPIFGDGETTEDRRDGTRYEHQNGEIRLAEEKEPLVQKN